MLYFVGVHLEPSTYIILPSNSVLLSMSLVSNWLVDRHTLVLFLYVTFFLLIFIISVCNYSATTSLSADLRYIGLQLFCNYISFCFISFCFSRNYWRSSVLSVFLFKDSSDRKGGILQLWPHYVLALHNWEWVSKTIKRLNSYMYAIESTPFHWYLVSLLLMSFHRSSHLFSWCMLAWSMLSRGFFGNRSVANLAANE